MASVASAYLLRDEYIDHRNTQDEQITREFRSVRESIGELNLRVDRLEVKVDRLEVKVDKLEVKVDRLEVTVEEIQLDIRRMRAKNDNKSIRNPIAPIAPIVSYRPGEGIVHPDPSLFPRHPREFYGLRDCRTERQKSVLAYLISFYDLPYKTWRQELAFDEAVSDDTSDESVDHASILSIDEAVRDYPDLAVDCLQDILGLKYDKIVNFEEKAAEYRQATSKRAMKRTFESLVPVQSKVGPGRFGLPRRGVTPQMKTREDYLEFLEEKKQSEESKSTDYGPLGWRRDSTPSHVRRRRRGESEGRDQQREGEGQEEGGGGSHPGKTSPLSGTTTEPLTASQGQESSRS